MQTPMVVKRGKIFRAGYYPNADGGPFTITPEDLQAAAAHFSGAPLRDTHREQKNSLLRGRLGAVQSLEVDPSDPENLIGEVAIPAWLDQALADTDLSVSAEWHRETKQLVGLALLTDPHITDAALFAAFSAASQGATGTTEPPESGRKEHSMSWTENLRNWVKGGMEGDAPAPEQINATVTAAPATFSLAPAIVTPDPEIAALKARMAATEAENIRLRQEGIADRAQAFYAAEFAAHRVVPAEEAAVIAAFTQAATDDSNHGVVTFSEGVTKSRVELLRAQYAARPAHVLTQEMVTAAGLTEDSARALFNQQTTARAGSEKPLTPERKAELMGMTSLGQASMNGHQN